MKPRVLVTIGDPSGVGPEVTLKSLASPKVAGLADFLVIGDGFVIDNVCRKTSLKLRAELRDLRNVPRRHFSYGKVSASFGRASVEYLDEAIRLLKSGKADALVTAPVNKSSIHLAGVRGFLGHTEYLASNTGSVKFAMMFVGKALKVTLVTRHIALKDVSRKLTSASIRSAIELTDKYLREYFGVRHPRIGVAGLNPHAGESGAFGNEEKSVIAPAVELAQKKIRYVIGPLPPDIIFHDAFEGRFDAVVAMYHDQALIPFKLLYFDRGVNLTIGLPFIRTSPDHGTAFDIAGKFTADPSSMVEAIKLACRLSRKG
ncbi:MAG: 4-hydroxythreonine-4-phosphate dehydrogenase PdxA [Candidatus Omnitrophica bacterium]|nr:4-hydroxythreonine-4-phosphate dehydrogenase PdxA [Candidatus Omnitrophota bacterium]